LDAEGGAFAAKARAIPVVRTRSGGGSGDDASLLQSGFATKSNNEFPKSIEGMEVKF